MKHQRRWISVLMATRNRADSLGRTLRRMGRLDRPRWAVRFVVVDNGSTDGTREAVEALRGSINVQYLYEPEGGKSRALNRALNTVRLGEVVVFTDDDVEPVEGWLRAIEDICRRRPGDAVFGGRVRVEWPAVRLPQWTEDPLIRSFGYAHQDLGERECYYPPKRYPFGANLWVRRSLIDDGARFDERVGPRFDGTIMGEDVLFVKSLGDLGHVPVYCPDAEIRHQVEPEAVTAAGIRRRAARFGRGSPYLYGYPHRGLRRRLPWLWGALRVGSICRDAVGLGLVMLAPGGDTRVRRSVRLIYRMASVVESMRFENDR